MIIKIVRKFNKIADSAQQIVGKASDIADNVETVSEMFKKSAGPLAIGKIFMNIADAVNKHKKGSK